MVTCRIAARTSYTKPAAVLSQQSVTLQQSKQQAAKSVSSLSSGALGSFIVFQGEEVSWGELPVVEQLSDPGLESALGVFPLPNGHMK